VYFDVPPSNSPSCSRSHLSLLPLSLIHINIGHKDALSIKEGEVGFGRFVSGSDQRYQPQFAPQAWS